MNFAAIKRIILIPVAMLLLGCSLKDIYKTVIVRASVVRPFGNTKLVNIKIHIDVYAPLKKQFLSVIIDSEDVVTDCQGNFSVEMEYNNEDNFVKFSKVEDENYTSIDKQLPLADIKSNPVVLEINIYEQFRVNVINKNPYDEKDQINVYNSIEIKAITGETNIYDVNY